jgi:hypothetical protein
MRSWKLALGLGAACAVCCAIPLLGVAGGLTALGAALWACADEFLPAAAVLGTLAAAMGGTWWWRRRRAEQTTACGCGTTCSTGASHVNN